MKLKPHVLFGLIATVALVTPLAVGQETKPGSDAKSLIAAAQQDDLAAVKQALDSGVDVNAKNNYGATALFFACDRGNLEMVKFLLEKGADPNVEDTFYQANPVTWARNKGHQDIVDLLFAAGAEGAEGYLIGKLFDGDLEGAGTLLAAGKLKQESLARAFGVVSTMDKKQQQKILPLFDQVELPAPVEAAPLSTEQKQRLTGSFRGNRVGVEIELNEDGDLAGSLGAGSKTQLVRLPIEEPVYLMRRSLLKFDLGDSPEQDRLELSLATRTFECVRATNRPEAGSNEVASNKDQAPAMEANVEVGEYLSQDLDVSSANWPGFRGVGSRGISDRDPVLTEWNVADADESENSKGLLWKTRVEGLGMSCPSIWADRIYITSAVADGEDQNVKIGLYGDVSSVEDDRTYEFQVVCLSKADGAVLWRQVAHRGKPAVKRHAKSSHANPTVATDGQHVVAFFGSEGLYCYSPDGELMWQRDLGLLDSGWFYDPGYQWGFGSSPVIYQDRVIVQCDVQGQSFLAAYRLSNGEQIWRQDRDEIPTWATPTVHEFDGLTMVVTNGTHAARGYDVETGEQLWSLSGHSEIVVPTPSVARGLIFVASGYSPIQPIYAIKPTARGDVSLADNATSNDGVQWSVKRGGPYMPTPIIYGDYLYCCANNGILSCHDAKTGEQVYRERMTAPGGTLSFTASPVASDGRLYFTAEDGRILVVQAGPKYKRLAVNELNESILSTPAMSEGVLYFRTVGHVLAIGQE